MRKKPGFTMVEQAVVLVPEFEKVVRKLEQQVTLRGQSSSTLHNYIRRIALFVTHFQRLPEQIETEEVNEYLASLALIYSAGLCGQEVINLKISDIDFERKAIHIRQSKYKKDRMVPLADSMAVGLRKYLKAENPHVWLFNGKEPDGRYSVRGLSWVMRSESRAVISIRSMR